MGICSPAVNITVLVTSATTGLTFQDDLYDYRYYRVVAQGPQASVVVFTLNGTAMSLPGSTVMDCAVYSLTVASGTGIVLHGVKSARKLFGDGSHPVNVEHPPYN